MGEDESLASCLEWAKDSGLFPDEGFGDGVAREAMAVVLLNAAVYAGKGPVGSWAVRLDYSDLEELSDWAVEGAMWCQMKRIIEGRPGKVFDPKAIVTRAEAAAMLHRWHLALAERDAS
jgi:hypothetical protein